MKTNIRQNILLASLVLISMTNYLLATPTLPLSSQEEKIEIVQEIKIEAQSSNTISNPKLKQGTACSDEDLEEAKGELFIEIPMAKTIPCDKVDCKDLAPAKMHKDNYVKLKTAKTTSCKK